MHAGGQVIVNASQASFSNQKTKKNTMKTEHNFKKINEECEKLNAKNEGTTLKNAISKTKKCNIL